MKTIEDILDKRNQLYQQMMDNYSFALVYNGELLEDEDQDLAMTKLQELDNAIYDFQHSQSDQAEGPSLNHLKKLVEDLAKLTYLA